MEGPYRASGCPKRSPSKRTSFTGQDQSEDRPSFHLSGEKEGYPPFLFEDLNHYSSFFNFEFERLLIGAEYILCSGLSLGRRVASNSQQRTQRPCQF